MLVSFLATLSLNWQVVVQRLFHLTCTCNPSQLTDGDVTLLLKPPFDIQGSSGVQSLLIVHTVYMCSVICYALIQVPVC